MVIGATSQGMETDLWAAEVPVGDNEGGVMGKLSKENEAVLDLIRTERMRQERKWGEQNHNDYYWLGILAEEFGEAAKILIEDARLVATPFKNLSPSASDHLVVHQSFQRPETEKLEKELVQIAAVAVAWIEAIHRRARKE